MKNNRHIRLAGIFLSAVLAAGSMGTAVLAEEEPETTDDPVIAETEDDTAETEYESVPDETEEEISEETEADAEEEYNAPVTYSVFVCGQQVTDANKNDILGDGTASFDPDTNTLTLNGEFDVTGGPYVDDIIQAQNTDLTVTGNAVLRSSGDTGGIHADYGKLTLKGKFEIYTGITPIYAGTGIYIDSGSLTAVTPSYICAVTYYDSVVIGKDVDYVEFSAETHAVGARDSIDIDDELYIKEPDGGYVSDRDATILTADGSVASHVVICRKTPPAPEFSGHQLVLTGSLGLKFGVKIPAGTDTEGSYMTFRLNGETQRINTSDAETAGDRKVYTCSMNTLQMAEEIEAVFHYGDGQEVRQNYSLVDYFSYFDSHASGFSAKTLKLVKAVADYGYYAQPYLIQINHLEGKYAPITKHYETSFDYDAILEAVAANAFTKQISSSAVTAASYKLSLDSDTALSVMMQVPAGTTVNASATFGGKTYRAEKSSSTVWVIKIPGIKASRLGTTITVSGTAGGNFTIKVSALSYVRSVLGGDYDSVARNAVSSLYAYYDAVRANNG